MSFRTPGGNGTSWNRINPINNIMGMFNGVFIKPKRFTRDDLGIEGFRESGIIKDDSRFSMPDALCSMLDARYLLVDVLFILIKASLMIQIMIRKHMVSSISVYAQG